LQALEQLVRQPVVSEPSVEHREQALAQEHPGVVHLEELLAPAVLAAELCAQSVFLIDPSIELLI
jgi:hypothetical protein